MPAKECWKQQLLLPGTAVFRFAGGKIYVIRVSRLADIPVLQTSEVATSSFRLRLVPKSCRSEYNVSLRFLQICFLCQR